MTTDVRITLVEKSQRRSDEWIIEGSAWRESEHFVGFTVNRDVVAMCTGAKLLDSPTALQWVESQGEKHIQFAQVIG